MTRKTNAKKLRWGILGCARVAQQVGIPGIQMSGNGEAAAIASRDPAKAKSFSQRFQIPKAYGSYRELLDDPEIDAVYIPLVNGLHEEWTIKAAQKGKHVLCEKILAANIDQARRMAEACDAAEVLLVEAYAYCFHPQNALVKEMIEQGRIGKVLAMTSVHSSGPPEAGDIRLQKGLAGGVMGDKGCYCVHAARWLTGEEPVTVLAHGEFRNGDGVDERISAFLEFASGVRTHFETSFRLAPGGYQQGYEIFGERGRIRVPEAIVQLPTYRRGEIVDTVVHFTDHDGHAEPIVIPGAHQWQLEMEHFADRVNQGPPYDASGQECVLNMKVMDAIIESAKRGEPVKLV